MGERNRGGQLLALQTMKHKASKNDGVQAQTGAVARSRTREKSEASGSKGIVGGGVGGGMTERTGTNAMGGERTAFLVGEE